MGYRRQHGHRPVRYGVDAPEEDVYCTVRDLTSGFNLTSRDAALTEEDDSADLLRWQRVGTADGVSGKHAEGATVTILGETEQVLSLRDADDTNGQWLCDQLMPGIEWLEVTCEYNGIAATRRVRVIPTASIDAGDSVLITNQLYDHADDVALFYSTGKRMNKDSTDITTGIFPDTDKASPDALGNYLSDRQIALMVNGRAIADTGADVSDYIVDNGNGNDLFKEAPVGYMSTTKGGDDASDSQLYVYVYEVADIDKTTNAIEIGDKPIDLFAGDENNKNPNALRMNGYEMFYNRDARYLVSYVWVLKDGRVLQDAKLVRRAAVPFDIALNLYEETAEGNVSYADGGYLYVSGEGEVLDNFTRFTAQAENHTASVSGTAGYTIDAQTAWKLKNDYDTMTSVRVTLSTGIDGEDYSVELTGSDLEAGKVFNIPCTEYRIVYKNNGYYTIPQEVERTYTLNYDETNGVWYINFEGNETSGEFPQNDVQYITIVDVTVEKGEKPNPPVPPDDPDDDTTLLTVTKLWAGDGNSKQPAEIMVQLYRSGLAYGEPVALNADNSWTYTWRDLSDSYNWTVDEVSVPDGYTKTISHTGTYWTITNTYDFMLNTTDHYAYIIGYPDGNVHPEADITRAEVATIFFRMLTDEKRVENWSTVNSFSDVGKSDWFNNAVSTMEKTGVINGYTDGTFRPNESITRAELVKIAVSFFKFTGNSAIEAQFTDIEGHWAQNYINFAVELGLVNGYPDGTFAPDKNVTRCEAMKVINHVLGRAPEKDHLLNNMIKWPDNSSPSAWYYAEVQEATNSHEYGWSKYNETVVERWTELLPVRDWAAFETAWADGSNVPNPGEVVQ